MNKQNAKLAHKMAYLDNPERNAIISPQEIFELISPSEKPTILDIGAGTGFLTIPAAKAFGGKVVALDMDKDMLDIIEERAKKADLEDIELLLGNAENIALADNSVDTSLASLVLHEMHDLNKVLIELNRITKAKGQLICLEFEKEEGSEKHMHNRISSNEMETALIMAGFKPIKKSQLAQHMYLLVAEKE